MLKIISLNEPLFEKTLHKPTAETLNEIFHILLKIDPGTDPNPILSTGETPFHIAVQECDWRLSWMFFRHPGLKDKNPKDVRGVTPMHYLVPFPSMHSMIYEMWDMGISKNPVSLNKNSVLIIAIKQKQWPLVGKLLDGDIPPDEVPNFVQKGPFGETAAYLLAQAGQLTWLKKIWAMGSEINPVTEYGITLISVAAEFGHWDIVKAVLDQDGAENITLPSHRGVTVMHHLVGCPDVSLIQRMWDLGAPRNPVDDRGVSVLDKAYLAANLTLVGLIESR